MVDLVMQPLQHFCVLCIAEFLLWWRSPYFTLYLQNLLDTDLNQSVNCCREMTTNTAAIPLVLIRILSYDLLIALVITWLERLISDLIEINVPLSHLLLSILGCLLLIREKRV